MSMSQFHLNKFLIRKKNESFDLIWNGLANTYTILNLILKKRYFKNN